ncbi:MAG TPA: DUF6766 family protein [Ktedonobacterales bacterium]|jgi:hypothetical protein|nr:DUF6766 family protein [Ktedonobacterales bacterium]
MAAQGEASRSFDDHAGRRHAKPQSRSAGGLLRFLHDHAVSSAMLLLFACSLVGQSVTGYREQAPSARDTRSAYGQYLVSSDFLETVAENWEGEFLPLTAYVLFTSFLHERGAKESRNPDKQGDEPTDKQPSPAEAKRTGASWPLRVGGPIRWIYLHSLPLAFLTIFLAAVIVHALSGLGDYNSTLVASHEHPVSVLGYLASNTFWLQSTRNWEAGFFSTAMLAVFSIFLREKGSPVSKDADQANSDTAEEGA